MIVSIIKNVFIFSAGAVLGGAATHFYYEDEVAAARRELREFKKKVADGIKPATETPTTPA